MRTRARGAGIAAVTALLAAAAVFGIAAPAQAHNYLVSSTPKSGGVLTTLPAEFSVTTNDVLDNVDGNGDGFALQIRDTKGLYYGDGCVSIDGPTVSATAAVGAPGKYTVIWQVISTDGHPVSNEIPFTWAPASGSTADTTASGSKTPPDCHGKLKPNVDGPVAVAPTGPTAAVSDGTLETVLWIGGAILAVGVAVVVTILVVSRKKPAPTGPAKE